MNHGRLKRRLLVLLLAGLVACLPATADTVSDEDVKLALVYKIARFVTWPDSHSSEADPFRFCVADKAMKDRATDRLSGRKIRDRAIEVRLLVSFADEFQSGCDIFYMAGVRKSRSADFLADAAGVPVLTVSDAPEFVASGGMIGLAKRGNKISMQINVAAYESSGLVISSQLLELADLVNDNRRARR